MARFLARTILLDPLAPDDQWAIVKRAEPADSYRYDPADPVPSLGGRTLHPNLGPGGMQNQATLEEREDVLVYTSARLTTPLAVAGPVSVTLFAASSAQDTDFTAKLVDIEPDGYCANIAEGIIRARHRSGEPREELLEPGEVTEFGIDLWDVAHLFRAGHRVRVEISSSNFPRFDRNLNTAVSPELYKLLPLEELALKRGADLVVCV